MRARVLCKRYRFSALAIRLAQHPSPLGGPRASVPSPIFLGSPPCVLGFFEDSRSPSPSTHTSLDYLREVIYLKTRMGRDTPVGRSGDITDTCALEKHSK